jgi:uncharacterized protein (TIGR02145 family)
MLIKSIFHCWNYSSRILNMFFVISLVVGFSSCEKDSDEEEVKVIETGSVTDASGITYKTVKIGGQWWMAEDLKTTVYRDGSPITQSQTLASWSTDQEGYCIFENNPAAPGLLYNWYAVNDSRNIAPQGWRVPTDQDWKVLEQYLGLNAADADKTGWRGTDQGEKLKSKGTSGWQRFGDVWPTNSSGFTALAGGCRLPNATFGNPGLFSTGFWWTISEHNSEESWYRHLDYKSKNIFRYHSDKNYGFSIRCIKE